MHSQAPDEAESRISLLLVAMLALVATHGAITVCLAQLLPPDSRAPAELMARLLVPFEFVRPEPRERRIFLANLLLLPFVALGAAALLRHGRLAAAAPRLPVVLAAIALLSLIPLSGRYGPYRLLQPSPFGLIAALTLALTTTYFAVAWRGVRVESGRARATALGVAIGFAAFLAFSWRTLHLNAVESDFRHAVHLDIVMYSVSQAAAGRVPLVDYLVQYGFFGTLLAPPFRATGTSVLAVSLVMNALQWLALACIAVVVFRRIMTLALAIGACAALFFVMGAWGPLRHQPDPYFQYYPLRILFPAISLWLVSRWMDRPRTRNTGLISCIAGIAILWNIDSGIAVAGAWIGLLAFQVLSAHVRHEDVRAAWAQLALAAVTAAVPLLLFGLWLRWRAGAPVDFGAAFVTQRLYYLQGVYMMPLPRRPHPWQFVLAVHAGAFLAGCAHALGKLANPRARLLHYLAFLGLGLFPYYQGRSHNLVLLTVAWPAVLIVFLLADWLWTLARSGRMRRGLAVAMTAPVLAFGVLCTVVLVRDVPGLTRLARRAWSARTAPLLPGVAGNVAFIRDNSGGRDAVVLAEFQGVYFAETGLATSIRAPSVLEVVTRAQAAAIVGEIRRLRPERLFLGAPYLEPGPDNPFDSLRSFLAERYRLQASTTAPQLWLYVRRDPE